MSHIAIQCRASGRIVEVLCDQVGICRAVTGIEGSRSGQEPAREPTLSCLVTPGGVYHLARMLALAKRNGAVCEWLLELQGPEDPVTFRLWAAHRDDMLLVLGTAEPEVGIAEVLEQMPLGAEAAAELTALVAMIRDRDRDVNAQLSDLRAQVSGLQAQVQPPPAIEDRLLSMAAHDLRNPLLVISMGCSYLLQTDNGLTAEQQSLLSESLETCEFMGQLVEGMVDLSQVAAGILRLERKTTDLADLVKRAVQRVEAGGKERGIQVELVKAAPISVEVDPIRISQVLNQILGNALTHCPKGTQVQVRLERVGDEVVITVQDNGPGIDGETLESLFRPFGKPKVSADPRDYRARLGLPIAHRIVEGHHGRIDVETALGRGSCFTVALPSPNLPG